MGRLFKLLTSPFFLVSRRPVMIFGHLFPLNLTWCFLLSLPTNELIHRRCIIPPAIDFPTCSSRTPGPCSRSKKGFSRITWHVAHWRRLPLDLISRPGASARRQHGCPHHAPHKSMAFFSSLFKGSLATSTSVDPTGAFTEKRLAHVDEALCATFQSGSQALRKGPKTSIKLPQRH